MDKPFMTRPRPFKCDYLKRTKDVIIYSYTELSGDDYDRCPECDEQKCTGQCVGLDRIGSNKDQPKIPNIKLEEINLQNLIDMLPDDITPCDVKIAINTDHWRGIPYITFCVFYKKEFPENLEQFEIDKEAYDKEWAEFELKRTEFNEEEANKEIKKLEKRIEELKNRDNSDIYL